MAKQAVAINLRMLKPIVINFLVFKPQFSRPLSRVFFSASSRLSLNFRGRLAGLAQIAAAGRLSRRLRGLASSLELDADITVHGYSHTHTHTHTHTPHTHTHNRLSTQQQRRRPGGTVPPKCEVGDRPCIGPPNIL